MNGTMDQDGYSVSDKPDRKAGQGRRRAARKAVPRDRPGERLHGAIARKLGVAIVSGAYKPGDVLDNEVESSEQLHVSRSAYREALRMLAAKGLVESRPKAGTRVTDQRRWSLLDPQVMAWFFEAGTPPAQFLRDLFELRMVLEPEAAALAAERRTSEDLARMRKALTEMERHGLAVAEGQNADREFHGAVIETSHNSLLIALISTIGAGVRWTTIFKQRHRKLPRDPMPDHWRVFDAIALGDAAAAHHAMRELVRLALEDTRFAIDG